MRRLRNEHGIALVMALLVMAAVAVGLTTVITMTSASGRNANRSSASQSAYSLAEAGVNKAMSILRLPENNALDPAVFCPAGQAPPCTTHDLYTVGYNDWTGTLDQSTGVWALTSTGVVRNPNGAPASPVTRRISATVRVHPTLTQPLNTPIWDYIYSTKPASALPTCDMTVTSSVTIGSPMYVEGNLCLQQSAAVTRGPLIVKGRLYLANKKTSGNLGNYVGQPAAPLSDAHIVNGCDYNGTLYASPCPGSGTANIWATVLDASVPTNLAPPTVDFNKWYLNASPGPSFPCQTVSGRAPISGYPVFDNPVGSISSSDAVRLGYKNNNQANQDLTPAASYRCETLSGELSWDAVSKVLTIRGTIYVDGSLYITNGSVNRYAGQGVIYVSGSFLLRGSGLCGKINNGACDNRTPANGGWDPNQNLLAIVAQGTGGQVNAGDSIQLATTSAMQGALYASGNIEIGQSATMAGPMVGQSVILGQSVSTSFPTISVVPDGMPANPTAYAEADPPSYSG